MTDHTCFIFGSGATKGSGLAFTKAALKYLKECGIIVPNKEIPTDQGFWKGIKVTEEHYPALSLLRERKPNITSMESAWSLANILHQKRQNLIPDSVVWRAINRFKDWGLKNINKAYKFADDLEKAYTTNGLRSPLNQNRQETAPHFFCGDIDTEWRDLIFKLYRFDNFGNSVNNDSYVKLLKDKTEFSIITFNYDLLGEHALGKCSKPWSYVSENGTSNGNGTNIVKLHGSLNWEQRHGNGPISFSESEIQPFYDGLNFLQPAMIPPTFNKVEISNEEVDPNQNDPIRRLIAKQWKMAEDILNKADRWIIIGYGFPETDFWAKKLFAKYSKNKTIDVVNPDKSLKFKKRVKEWLPGSDHELHKKTFEGLRKIIK